MSTLRVPGALIGLGFLGVLAWTIVYLIAVLPGGDPGTIVVYEVTTTVGYVLAGLACWRWIVTSATAGAGGTAAVLPSRLMAVASFVTAAGVAALTYQLYQNNRLFMLENLNLHYALRLTSDIAGVLGFLLAAAGFWMASMVKPGDGNAQQPEQVGTSASLEN